jgi:hypothetical protein
VNKKTFSSLARTFAPVTLLAWVARAETPIPQGAVASVPLGTSSAVASTLPVPEAPPAPTPRQRFAVPKSDPAGVAARSIARRVAHFRAYRGEIPGADWSIDETASWSIRADAACKRELLRLKVPFVPLERPVDLPLVNPVPSPVVITGLVEGVHFRSVQTDREVAVSCELALRLPALARIFKKHGVRLVHVTSSLRDAPRTSFHTFGLALDIAGVQTKKEDLWVGEQFELTPNEHTCAAQPAAANAQLMLGIVCDIAQSHLFSSVLTPNYNAGHRDHFHLDVRPDDPRFFLR